MRAENHVCARKLEKAYGLPADIESVERNGNGVGNGRREWDVGGWDHDPIDTQSV